MRRLVEWNGYTDTSGCSVSAQGSRIIAAITLVWCICCLIYGLFVTRRIHRELSNRSVAGSQRFSPHSSAAEMKEPHATLVVRRPTIATAMGTTGAPQSGASLEGVA